MNTQRDNSYHKLSTICEKCGNTSCGEMDICYGCINKCVCLAKKEKGNLTMREKLITIIIDNYNNEKITFTMPSDATVETMFEMDPYTMEINRVHIDAKANDIEIEKEDIIPSSLNGMEFGF